jgi:antitoxin HicB
MNLSTMFKYSIHLDWSNEDDCYLATIKEFPGLSAFGDTPEQAAHEAQIAAEAMIEVMKEDGEEIPAPLWPSDGITSRKQVCKELFKKRDDVNLLTYSLKNPEIQHLS